MKIFFFLLGGIFFFHSQAQEIPDATQEQMENLARNDELGDDDQFLQQLEIFRHHPVNLNEAGEESLRSLYFLTDLQIGQFLHYRDRLGKLISLTELQAVPGWDLATIRKLLSYVTLSSPISLHDDLGNRLRKAEQSLLFRFSMPLQKALGYTGGSNAYAGGREKLFLRYTFLFRDQLGFGITAEKDGGEKFFGLRQKAGFDFYSFHFFLKKAGPFHALALGDFTVNMGQGLVQWQSMAFKKSGDITAIKRQADVLRPYNSSGEFNFERGAGASFSFKKIMVSLFGSFRKLDASLGYDTIGGKEFITSFITSGYHRTKLENEKKGNVRQLSAGISMQCRPARNLKTSLNAVCYQFSLPVQKSDEPYHLYAMQGRSWRNMSMDYSYTFRNAHFFGEMAIDKNFSFAQLHGLLLSLNERADLSIVYRDLSPKYQAVNANAFTESSVPSNEKGIFTGIVLRPAVGWKIDVYADHYIFPWLRYQVDAPGDGQDYLLQCNYAPAKKTELTCRLHWESKMENQQGNIGGTNEVVPTTRSGLRLQLSHAMNAAVKIRERVEFNWYNKGFPSAQNGFAAYLDVYFSPLLKKYSFNLRGMYISSDGYDARIYAYENDVLYSQSITAFFETSFHFYFNLHYKLNKKLETWLNYSQTTYPAKTLTGSGLDVMSIKNKINFQCQLRWLIE